MVLLPLLAFAACWLALFSRFTPQRGREAFLVAALIWGVATTVITEGLSLGDAFMASAVGASWLILSAAALATTSWSSLQRHWAAFRRPGTGQVSERAVLSGLAIVAGLVGIGAITGGISTNDVLDYHLPRIMHWIQDRDVGFYPTAVSRQLNSAPWSEYAMAQFLILGGGDAWANLVQWFAFVGCAVGSSLIARQLGAGTGGQWFAAVFAMTIPMAVLQGATAQNDLCVAFWVVTMAWAILGLVVPSKSRPVLNPVWAGVAIGAAVGLAILTKTTGYLFVGPLVVLLGVLVLARWRWRVVPMAIAAGGVLVALNVGFWQRNLTLYGRPLGPGQESPPGQDWGRYTNAVMSVETFVSNVVRFLALNVNPPSPEGAAEVTRRVESLLQGWGIDADDPGTTWTGQAFSVAPLHTNEDGAGNLVHLVIIGLVLLLVPVVPALRRWPVVLYSLAAVGGFLAFCFLLKWSPWSTRLYLTSLVLFAPVVGLAIGQIRRAWVPRIAAIVLLVGTAPYLLFAQHRPILGADPYQPTVWEDSTVGDGHNADLFVTRPWFAADFTGAMAMIEETRCGQVGLWRFDTAEYPVWALLGTQSPPPRIQHVGVMNDTRRLADQHPHDDFAPCLVIGLRTFTGDEPTAIIDGRSYTRVWDSSGVAVYRPTWYLTMAGSS